MSHTITEPTQEWIMLCYDVDALILSTNFSDLVFLGYSFVIWCRKDSRWEENKETWDFWSRWSNDHESKSKVISYWLQVLPNPSAGSFFADVWRSGQWRSGQRHSGHWPERKTFRPVPGDFQASKKKYVECVVWNWNWLNWNVYKVAQRAKAEAFPKKITAALSLAGILNFDQRIRNLKGKNYIFHLLNRNCRLTFKNEQMLMTKNS
jgi:hypothetical protein